MEYHNRRKRVEIAREDGMTSYKLSKMAADLRCLTGVTKSVLRTICDRYPRIWAGIATLAAESGFSGKSVQRSIRTLETAGILSSIGDKRGGRGNSEQYVVNVQKIRSLLETQSQSPSPEEDPATQTTLTLSDRPHLDVNLVTQSQKAVTVTVEQRSNRETLNREREQRTAPFSSDQKQDHGQEILVYLVGQSLKFVPKQQTAIREVATRYPFPVLKRACDACLSGLEIGNSWDHCEEKLTANLDFQCQAILRQDEESRKTQEMIARCIANEKAKVAKEFAENARKQAEEEAYIEDEWALLMSTLGSEDSL